MAIRSKKQRWAVLRELGYLLKAHKLALLIILVASVLVACLNMTVPKVAQYAIDNIFLSDQPGRLRLLLIVVGVILAVYVGKNAVFYLFKSRITKLGEILAFDLRMSLLAHLHKLSVSFYKRNKPGKISTRLMQDVDSIKQFVQNEFGQVLINLLMLFVAAALILQINWRLGLVCLAVLPLHFLIYRHFSGSIGTFARLAKEYVSDISGDLVEQFTGVEIVKSYVSESKEQERFRHSMSRGMHAQIRQHKYYLLQKVWADMLVGLSVIALFGFGGYAVIYGPMKPGAFAAFYFLLMKLYPLSTKLIGNAAKLLSTRASVERVYEILHLPPEVSDSPAARERPIVRGEIVFENVSFSYGDRPVLENLNLRIRPGEHVLITGPSGSGKTTFLNFIPRFADPNSGRILIDGIDIREFTLASLRDQIGIVFQDCFLFNTSVLENVRYAHPGATDEDVIEACRKAYAHEFIKELPEGYYTIIGEGGIQLSGGQRQRLVIARTLLKNPRLLILDEAIASLDSETRQKVGRSLLELGRGKTMCIVTNSYSIFADIDKEIRLKEGQASVYSRASLVH